MTNVYEKCPIVENEELLLRLTEEKDSQDLLAVYSDKFALPFFNSDNCHGSNFYITNEKDILNMIHFWNLSYKNKEFVRFTIIDKQKNTSIGTVEMFKRESSDFYNGCGVLRLDLRRDCENSDFIFGVLNMILPLFFELFDCAEIITKAPIYAVERIDALKKFGFCSSAEYLIGTTDGRMYGDYWIIEKIIH